MAESSTAIQRMQRACTAAWYSTAPPPWWARGLAGLFGLVTSLRRALYRGRLLPRYRAPVPVIVVGNLTVGGTGKTPFVVWLVAFLRAQGWRPGVVTRGYGGRASSWPRSVTADSDPDLVGDEAVLLARLTDVPVVADPQRKRAVALLVATHHCNIVVSDDGLQHYALDRDLEIVIVDGARRWGNGKLLPAGPLREPVTRAARADFILSYGAPGDGEFALEKHLAGLRQLGSAGTLESLDRWRGRRVHAVAGIGHPQQFFAQLEAAGLIVLAHPFPDHWRFSPADFAFDEALPIVMTEKDAVKCARFGLTDAWQTVLNIEPDPRWVEILTTRTRGLMRNLRAR